MAGEPTAEMIEFVARRLYEREGEVYPNPHMPDMWEEFLDEYPSDELATIIRERARICINAMAEWERRGG